MTRHREYHLHVPGMTISVPLAPDEPPPAMALVLGEVQHAMDARAFEAGRATLYVVLSDFPWDEWVAEWEDRRGQET